LCARGFCAAQDTPGYGDDTDIDKSIRMVVDYVRQKNEDHFQNGEGLTDSYPADFMGNGSVLTTENVPVV
jgi:hypothetical protein